MRLGISLPNFYRPADQDVVLPLARAAERAGFHSVWVNDHFLRLWDIHFAEPLSVAMAMAAATERLAVGTSVLVVPYRDPVLLAHATATIDSLSRGRFVLGVGAGGAEPEFDVLGIPFAERGRRTDAALERLVRLWGDGAVEGAGVPVGTTSRGPGRPALWVGGDSRAALRRALCFGAAWHGASVSPERMPEIRRRLEELGAEVDRDPATLELTTTALAAVPGLESDAPAGAPLLGGPGASAAAVVEALGRLEEAGITTCVVWVRHRAEHVLEALGWLAAEVLPQVHSLSSSSASSEHA
jgi:alkanesulfonate monooxygenase SsuD/methylene tetrahydromethanopterin reductase-like flavin-dependent oxidoreductase (luciferase family)